MRILIIEDDAPYGDDLCNSFEARMPDAEILWLTSERDFVEQLDEIEKQPHDVALIDVMLRWDVPRRDLKAPETVDIYKAGIRCMQKLKGNPKTADMPIILYSIVAATDVTQLLPTTPEGVVYMQKTSDFSKVMSLVRDVTSGRRCRA